MNTVSLCSYAKERHKNAANWRNLWTLLVFILGTGILLFLLSAILFFITEDWVAAALTTFGAAASGGATAFLERQRKIAVEEEERAYAEVVKYCASAVIGDVIRQRFSLFPTKRQGASEVVEKPRVRVAVLTPNGEHLELESSVLLINERRRVPVNRKTGRLWYEVRVEPDEYELTVSVPNAPQWAVRTQRVNVPSEGADIRMHLGEEGWPFYRIGETIIPFRPPKDNGRELVALVFDGRVPGQQMAEGLRKGILADNDGQILSIDMRAGGAIWILRIDEQHAIEPLIENVLREVAEVGVPVRQFSPRVGVPVDMIENQLTVLTNRFLVRFVEPSEIDQHLNQVGGRIVRHSFLQDRRLKLIELAGNNYVENQEIIETWYAEGTIDYSEPDLSTEIALAAFPSSAPDDPEFDQQGNIVAERIMEAWQYLHGIDVTLTLGSPDVYVATIDTGVNPNYGDCTALLSDGTQQLAECFDFRNMIPCSDANYVVYEMHGMGVYGIISAFADNANNIAGIAPNCHHIGIRYKGVTSSEYGDMLMWASGFQPFQYPDEPPDGWPAPIDRPADVINCSHSPRANSIALDATFEFLARNGRDGLGTIIVYAAGNYNKDITLTSSHKWAASPYTIAVSNAALINGAEKKFETSNFGEPIDLCARGADTRTINQFGTPRWMGGTSAAAPAVSATVALMISVCPSLTWEEIRDILRSSAVMIDPDQTDPAGAWVNGRSDWYGYGRLDIASAVQAAAAACSASEASKKATHRKNRIGAKGLARDVKSVDLHGGWK